MPVNINEGAVRGKISGMTGGGGFGVNLTDHLNLSTELGAGAVDASGSINGGRSVIAGKPSFTAIDWRLGLDYNIMKTRLTPVVTGGVGIVNVSGFGLSETFVTYGGGGGLRWDFTDRFYAKALYRLDGVSSTTADVPVQLLHGFYASIGFKF